MRWEIATRAANSQSVALDMLVREIIGDKIEDTLDIISTMILGPELEGDIQIR